MGQDAATRRIGRMRPDDMRAALIYQRATSDADRLIADRLSTLVDEHRGRRLASEGDEVAPWLLCCCCEPCRP
jgi:hypothetical protein